jgi:hypothetical protein
MKPARALVSRTAANAKFIAMFHRWPTLTVETSRERTEIERRYREYVSNAQVDVLALRESGYYLALYNERAAVRDRRRVIARLVAAMSESERARLARLEIPVKECSRFAAAVKQEVARNEFLTPRMEPRSC